MTASPPMKTRGVFEPHLTVKEAALLESSEWKPHFHGWCFLQVRSGVCYWQQANGCVELSSGSSMVFTQAARGLLRASQLGAVVISYFCMEPQRLTGLLTLTEQGSLKKAAQQQDLAIQTLPAAHPISERFLKLCQTQSETDVSLRLQLLQLFTDLFAREMAKDPCVPLDGRGRLRQLLNEMVESEFVDLSLSDLEPKMKCSMRHLSRLFRDEVGTSFRKKQMEVRLYKACELLTTSNAKVVDVALESGYLSSSVFSELFKKRLGVTPGQWRRRVLKSGLVGRANF